MIRIKLNSLVMGQAHTSKTCTGESCACDSSAYASSGLGGAFGGMMGMFGVGSMFKSTNPGPLNKAKAEMLKMQEYWTSMNTCLKGELQANQAKYVQDEFTMVQDANTSVTNTLGFEIKRNTLLIGMLCVLVLFLIIYDLSVPLPKNNSMLPALEMMSMQQ
jgi:hypothetical protein